ncbi:MAG: hypothetical protein QXP97_08090 [Desulfurococcus sp.]|uniref:hypothetical protein n=1 Tax=Desulfurococcus sp. TaxID=51678 RepID=UPI003161AD2A
MQASEKLYKVAEECVRALAIRFGILEAVSCVAIDSALKEVGCRALLLLFK